MAFYGWVCLVVLPFLVAAWLGERRESAAINRIRKGGGR